MQEARGYIESALAELQTPPRWETPEQREKRTGEAWPENNGVYYRHKVYFGDESGDPFDYRWVNNWALDYWKWQRRNTGAQIVCATEAGPPPDGWRPE
jgi:hypothetical protein